VHAFYASVLKRDEIDRSAHVLFLIRSVLYCQISCSTDLNVGYVTGLVTLYRAHVYYRPSAIFLLSGTVGVVYRSLRSFRSARFSSC